MILPNKWKWIWIFPAFRRCSATTAMHARIRFPQNHWRILKYNFPFIFCLPNLFPNIATRQKRRNDGGKAIRELRAEHHQRGSQPANQIEKQINTLLIERNFPENGKSNWGTQNLRWCIVRNEIRQRTIAPNRSALHGQFVRFFCSSVWSQFVHICFSKSTPRSGRSIPSLLGGNVNEVRCSMDKICMRRQHQ